MDAPETATTRQDSAEQVPSWLKAIIAIPLGLLGGVVSAFYSLSVGAYILSRVTGGLPTPELSGLMILWFIFGGLPLSASIALLGSPTSRRFWWRVLLVIVVLSVVAAGDGKFGPTRWSRIFARERLPGTDALKLQKTIVSPHVEIPLAPGTNVLWCGTFQLAWNEACRIVGGEIRLDRTDPVSTLLNTHWFTKDSLDETSYVAKAGFVKDNIGSKIQEAIDQKFHGTFKPRFIPDPALTRRPDDLVAYACLYKKLSFPVPFERLDEALMFGDMRVPAFGLGTFKPSIEEAYPQVLILDYQGENDFVIELKTKSDGDRLVLAKIAPKQNLRETVTNIQSRIASGRSESGHDE